MTVLPETAPATDERPAFLGPDLSPDEDAPYGYMIDPVSGGRRPKKKPGRPRDAERPLTPDGGLSAPPGPPSIEQLRAKAAVKEAQTPDRPPGAVRDGRGKPRVPKPPVDVPPFRAGPIAKGVNKLYVKIGKIVRIGDPDVGNAIIACTRKALIRNDDGALVPDPDDVTVGEAWEELAKTNPRIRAFLLKLISGGAWTALFMAHAPIFLAVVMKDGIRQRIPFGRLIGALLVDDDGQEYEDFDDDGQDGEQEFAPGFSRPSDLSAMLGGLTPDDMAQMSTMFGGLMTQMAGRVPQSARAPVVDDFAPETEPPP